VITDNLAPLLTSSDKDAVRFRQGTILAWDSDTGENTIDVAGATLTDVPILNTGEAIALDVGDVVGLLLQGLTWFIIGRVTPANDPQFASNSMWFTTDTGTSTNFGLSTSLSTVASVNLVFPPWVGQAIITVTGWVSLANTRAASDFAQAQCSIEFAGSGAAIQHGFGPAASADNQHVQAISAGYSAIVNNPSPSVSCTIDARAVGAAWSTVSSNLASITATAICNNIHLSL